MQRSLLAVYHVLRTGRFPRDQPRCKPISFFLILIYVFLCTKLIINYPFSSISTKFSECGVTVWE